MATAISPAIVYSMGVSSELFAGAGKIPGDYEEGHEHKAVNDVRHG
jgi:hypothetical protein